MEEKGSIGEKTLAIAMVVFVIVGLLASVGFGIGEIGFIDDTKPGDSRNFHAIEYTTWDGETIPIESIFKCDGFELTRDTVAVDNCCGPVICEVHIYYDTTYYGVICRGGEIAPEKVRELMEESDYGD